MCAMLAVDIVDFTRPDRNEQIRLDMHKSLYQILRDAIGGSEVGWADCHVQHRGDGALIVLPPEYPVTCLIGSFPDRLRASLRRYNRDAAEHARMQLRAAVNVGPVYLDQDGVSGDDVTLLCRILEAPHLSYALACSESVLAFAVSEYVYSRIVQRHPDLIDPDSFKSIKVQVKHTYVEAWMLAPGDLSQWPTMTSPEG
jgi:hypothetical protein